MLQPKSLCHMNVIPPYGRPALIPLVTSMDNSEKKFTSTPSVDGTARSQGKSNVSRKATSSWFTCCFLKPLVFPTLSNFCYSYWCCSFFCCICCGFCLLLATAASQHRFCACCALLPVLPVLRCSRKPHGLPRLLPSASRAALLKGWIVH